MEFGAIAILLFSQYFNKNNFTLFIGGFFIGSATEYIISFLVEIIMHTRWWDYSDRILNFNGRICLLYAIFWGILTVLLVKKLNPQIDKFITKIKEKVSDRILKRIVAIVTIFLLIDCILTCYAQEQFITRMIVENAIEVENKEVILKKYEKTYQNKILSDFIYAFWDDKKMIQTFPNIKIEDKEKNIIYIDSLLPEIQNYYLKIFDK